MKDFVVSRLASFRYAFEGLRFALRTQHNTWIHAATAVAVFLLALWLKLSTESWAILVLTVSLVFTAELLNTAIEATLDLASARTHPLAKVGKDTAAAAVLVAALFAIVVGVLVLGPPLWAKVAYHA